MNRALRQKVARRARGRCEYCRTPFRFSAFAPEVDHVIAQKHRGQTVLSNLAMACFHCNAHKGPNIAGIDPQTGAIVRLFHPRRDHWHDHFVWADGELVGRTEIGRATIDTLFINDPLEVAVRASLMQEGLF